MIAFIQDSLYNMATKSRAKAMIGHALPAE